MYAWFAVISMTPLNTTMYPLMNYLKIGFVLCAESQKMSSQGKTNLDNDCGFFGSKVL